MAVTYDQSSSVSPARTYSSEAPSSSQPTNAVASYPAISTPGMGHATPTRCPSKVAPTYATPTTVVATSGVYTTVAPTQAQKTIAVPPTYAVHTTPAPAYTSATSAVDATDPYTYPAVTTACPTYSTAAVTYAPYTHESSAHPTTAVPTYEAPSYGAPTYKAPVTYPATTACTSPMPWTSKAPCTSAVTTAASYTGMPGVPATNGSTTSAATYSVSEDRTPADTKPNTPYHPSYVAEAPTTACPLTYPSATDSPHGY
jgi:hypothetical protein